jgi:hypothetical protein
MTPNNILENLVDQVADSVLFGDAMMIELPAALGCLVIDLMAVTAIRDPQRVEQRLLLEFHSRLDRRLCAAVDDVGGARWRAMVTGLAEVYPTLH